MHCGGVSGLDVVGVGHYIVGCGTLRPVRRLASV